MSVENQIHVNDIGTIFRLTITDENGTAVDISGATTKTIYFRAPDNTLLTKAGSFYTDGTDGILQYTTVSGDIDQVGEWNWQAYVKLAAWEGYSEVLDFRVYENV